MTVTTFRPYSAEYVRIDRRALAKYLQGIVSEGRASLDAEGEFAFTAQPTDYDTFGTPMGMLVDPNSTQNVDQDWITLKLWGALSPEQRKRLIAGEKIPFKNLTDAQFNLVARKAYHSARRSGSGVSVLDIQRAGEPTEWLPDGLPRDGFLSVKAANEPAVLASSTQKEVRMSYVRIFDLQWPGQRLWQATSRQRTVFTPCSTGSSISIE